MFVYIRSATENNVRDKAIGKAKRALGFWIQDKNQKHVTMHGHTLCERCTLSGSELDRCSGAETQNK